MNKVFFDPEKKRWKLITKIVLVLIGLFTLLTYLFIGSILIDPILPQLGLKPLNFLHSKKTDNAAETKLEEKNYLNLKKQLEGIKKTAITKDNSVTNASRQTKNFAFYVEWDENSFSSLSRNISQIDYLLPIWLTIDKNTSGVSELNQNNVSRTVSFLKSLQNKPKVLPVVNNFDNGTNTWMTGPVVKMLDSSEMSKKFIDELKAFVETNGFAGITLDLEEIPEDHYAQLVTFNKSLWTEFNKDHLLVSSTLPLENPGMNYSALAKWNDYLIVMAYDEHWASSDAGPVASQKWYEQTLLADSKQIPKEKMVIALGNYGYDWQAGNKKEATTVTFQDAIQIAKDSEGDIELDDKSLNPTFDYYDNKNNLHHIYFLDAITAFNEIKFAQDISPYGYALWRLGSEDPSYWQVFTKDIAVNLDKLKNINYLYDLNYEGSGDILKLKNEASTGIRDIGYDKDLGMIISENYTKYPQPFTIERFGKSGQKEVALTFDDGPDPNYTPEILDILKRNNVKATFFIIGSNAEKYPDLLQRVYDEGHLIGNHTFTHPNITLISDDQLRLELNLFQKLLESVIGVHTLLFRPPYSEDIEPETVDQVLPLKEVSSKGYYTIGISLDPYDWNSSL